MERLTVWVGGGIVGAGVSAAVIAGAGAAHADTDAASDSGRAGPSAPAKAGKSGQSGDAPKAEHKQRRDVASTASRSGAKQPAARFARSLAKNVSKNLREAVSVKAKHVLAKAESRVADRLEQARNSLESAQPAQAPTKREALTKAVVLRVTPKSVAADPGGSDRAVADAPLRRELSRTVAKLFRHSTPEPTAAASAAESPIANAPEPALRLAATKASDAVAAATTVAAPAAAKSPFAVLDRLPTPIKRIGSLALRALAVAERIVVGPARVPPASTVTVQSSTLDLGNGQTVPADWYFPAGDTPPERMIYLQHGFLATGPMYSYTAAHLAQSTNSVVVAPSLSSDFFGADDRWLGGDGMHDVIAALFVGDRDALTASAVAAGYATHYGLDAADAQLPQKFALVGHSLGGAAVAGAAGYLAENGGAQHLVGVILLDGVPTGTTMTDALRKLQYYEDHGGAFIPVREIGAPNNLWNSVSNVNQALAAERPDHYNGVVLVDGVHMDSMQGGNVLIQFAAYVAAGIPRLQNPPAVQILATEWLNDWFGGDTGESDWLEPGSSFDIPTDRGVATAIVLGGGSVPTVYGTVFDPAAILAVVRPELPRGNGLQLSVSA
ncbi:alpha/beta hydrolase [[Mycobacterium] burgundiense]|uniref:Alpha/beta hydrolase n=1 Tax=[Mycobacterium] burgundiense TaxID=3064286 RepID=A0ABM9LGS9_9MYCO|nr:alpha/beta hydrolase [Mycolicibacterium sp. MU0053]CAJ1498782.1 alpha/beta hydrolase [Mycolicibacterium sp. MU0053]